MSAKSLTILCSILCWTLHITHSLIHCVRLCAPQMHRSISYHSVQCTFAPPASHLSVQTPTSWVNKHTGILIQI